MGRGWHLAGSPLELVQPDTLRWKVLEPVLLLGKQRFEGVDIRIRASGGGHVSQIYGAHSQLAQHSFELFTVVQVGILIMFNFSLASTMQCATEQGSIGLC